MWSWYSWISVYLAAFCILNPGLNSVLNPGVKPSVSASREGFGAALRPLGNRGDNSEGTITLPGSACDRMKHLADSGACFQCSSLLCGRNTKYLSYKDSLLQMLCVYCLQTSAEQSPAHSVAQFDDRSSSDGYQWHAPVVMSEEKWAEPWKRAQKYQGTNVLRKRIVNLNTMYGKRSDLIQSTQPTRENLVFDVTIPKRTRKITNRWRHAALINVPFHFQHSLLATLRKLVEMRRSRHDSFSLVQKLLASLKNIQNVLRNVKKYNSDYRIGQTDDKRAVLSDAESSNERYKELLFLRLLTKLKIIDQSLSTTFSLKPVPPVENNMLASKRQHPKLPDEVLKFVMDLGLRIDEIEHLRSSRSELSDDVDKQYTHKRQEIQPPRSTAAENQASIESTLLATRVKQLADAPYRKLYRTRPVTNANDLWTLYLNSVGADIHYGDDDGGEKRENVAEKRKERIDHDGHRVENAKNGGDDDDDHDGDDDAEEEEDDENGTDNYNGDNLWEYPFEMVQNESTLEKGRDQLGEGSQARPEVFEGVRPQAEKRWGSLGAGKFRTWWLGKRNVPINP